MLMVAIDTLFLFEEDEIKNKRIRRSFGIFAAELLDGFVELGVHNQMQLVVSDDAVEFIKERFPQYKINILKHWTVDFMRFLHRGKQRHIGEFIKLGIYTKLIDRGNFNVIWFPFSLPSQVIDCKTPKITTIHDLIFYHNSTSGDFRVKFTQMAHKANHIVAISQFIKDDICTNLNIKEDKVSVIPNSIDLRIEKEAKLKNLDRPYILDINGYAKHKNTITLIKAFQKIKDKIGLDLVFCGGWQETEYISMLKNYIADHRLENRVHLYFQIPEAERNYLLKHANLFVTPSTNEGFGRTPVEAAICGVPVISTKVTSLYEATKGLVNYYEEPENVDELAEKILDCLQKSDVNNLKKISEELAGCYSPKNCAKMYWDVFNKFCNV